ncbi:HDOD domain-containing protein [Clostridium sp. MSJ-8]|uniref:EAL and HDOD domain-containing protein n=1 Tax=Clostridium sp. MSJ-8 TaxID=2841510 RepID=UPI001C0EE772|nr:HDOD domain-containing protein [Clostridium sp. MSJ-8]MBU5487486.1 HDOD domain-containing protein [Clostridium sp. MSJ-8]
MDIFFVRQAVYDKNRNVLAYEIAFNKQETLSDNLSLEDRRLKFVCNMGTVGLNRFTNNKKAFINFTTISILEEIPDLLGKDNIIVQLNKNIDLDYEVIKSIQELHRSGFTIAYKDVCSYEEIEKIIPYLDIVKIDINNVERRDILSIVAKLKDKKIKLLANNVTSEELLDKAISDGFYMFEGEYFSKPVIVNDKDIAVRNSNRFNIIVELLNEEVDIERIEYIIKSDLSISYKLIRFLNSSTFGFIQTINSIKQAIMLLGRDELRKWLTLIAISEMQVDNNEELVKNTIARGRFCELLAEKIVPQKKSKAFMVGLFSDLDLFMDKPMKTLVEEVHLEKEVSEALLGEENSIRKILELVKAYEKMDVRKVQAYCEELNIDKQILFDIYSEAIDWVNETNI